MAVFALSLASVAGAQPSAVPLADGEMRKVDKDSKKTTLKHGPLTQLDMPGMTMVFLMQDEAVLDQVHPGDRVRFSADKVAGRFVGGTPQALGVQQAAALLAKHDSAHAAAIG